MITEDLLNYALGTNLKIVEKFERNIYKLELKKNTKTLLRVEYFIINTQHMDRYIQQAKEHFDILILRELAYGKADNVDLETGEKILTLSDVINR